jgi:hypothetical protein
MRHCRTNPERLIVSSTILALALLGALAAPVFAQRPAAAGPPADRSDPDRARFREMKQRELQLRNNGIDTSGSADNKRSAEAMVAQITKDFDRITLLHNQLVHAVSAENVLNFKGVVDATDEIKKRATRLQATLPLLRHEEGNQSQPHLTDLSDVQVKDALISLCKRIKSFVTNPVFETAGLIDIQQAERARNDLSTIIELSGSVTQSVQRLKATRK